MIDKTCQNQHSPFYMMGCFDQIKQRRYQELPRKITKPCRYNLQLNHKDLKILTSLLSMPYLIEQQQKTILQKQLSILVSLERFFESGGLDSVSTILKNHLSNSQLTPFSIHQKNVFFKQYKSLWVSLTLKNSRFYSVFDTPVGDTQPIYFLGVMDTSLPFIQFVNRREGM